MIFTVTTGGCYRLMALTMGFVLLWGITVFMIMDIKTLPPDVRVPRPISIFQEPSIDNRPSLSSDELMKNVQERMPNLPTVYWHKYKDKRMGFNNSCARFPSILNLKYNNLYWQTLQTSDGTFQLFGAYLDVRLKNRFAPSVRILGMINRVEPTVTTYCQFWFDGKDKPVIKKSFEYKYIWYRDWGGFDHDDYQPYLISCVIPDTYGKKMPESVSIVENPCDHATTNLRVIYDRPDKKKDFAVCVKGLDFLHQDLSVHLVEWIELLGLLGAEMIYFYELQVHPNITKVLRHYEKIGRVHVTPLTLPGSQPNVPSIQHLYLTKRISRKRQNELVPYNDCFYKNMYRYKWIALLDVDEVIMPINDNTWRELMDRVISKQPKGEEVGSSYNARNVYFLDDFLHDHDWFEGIPKYMHMLQHVYRARNFNKPGYYVKSFHNTELILTLHNHYPISCLGGCSSKSIAIADGYLHHYRADCVSDLKKTCNEYRKSSVMDTTIWKYKELLISRVSDTLKTLGYFRTNSTENTTMK